MHFQAGVICAAIGAVLSFAFGVWPEALTFLLVLMGIDYISGVAATVRTRSGLDSSVGFRGLAKKGLTLLVILLAHRIDVLIGINAVMGSAIAFYAANELLSVIENYGLLGLPLPDSIKRTVRILRNREENGGK